MPASLGTEDFQAADLALSATDKLLRSAYPGDSGARQPIHTVYVPGHLYAPGLAAEWGASAVEAVNQVGGLEALVPQLDVPSEQRSAVVERVTQKLATEPIEDLRIDFEDGFGHQSDAAEDMAVVQAASSLARDIALGTAPPFVGIRFKGFESDTRDRGIRTLDIFLTSLVEACGRDGLPKNLELTLPKVSTVAQVEVMVSLLEKLEHRLALPQGLLTFEVQVETPQLVIAADGRLPLAQVLRSGRGRISGLHYGTYDYTASLGIAAAYQTMRHPAAVFAKNVMQVAAAGTGVRLSDGSSNMVPTGGLEDFVSVWKLHANLVTGSLETGYFQGWDLHPTHLVSRYIASFTFFRRGVEDVTARLRNFVQRTSEGYLDEPATARALAGFLVRGVMSGALSPEEIHGAIGLSSANLVSLAFPRRESGTGA